MGKRTRAEAWRPTVPPRPHKRPPRPHRGAPSKPPQLLAHGGVRDVAAGGQRPDPRETRVRRSGRERHRVRRPLRRLLPSATAAVAAERRGKSPEGVRAVGAQRHRRRRLPQHDVHHPNVAPQLRGAHQKMVLRGEGLCSAVALWKKKNTKRFYEKHDETRLLLKNGTSRVFFYCC
jgi:hypothetical protein